MEAPASAAARGVQAGGAGGLGRRGRGGGDGHHGRKEKKGHVAVGRERKASTGPGRQQQSRQSQQQCLGRLPEQGEGETAQHGGGEQAEGASGSTRRRKSSRRGEADRAATRRGGHAAEKSPLSARADGVRKPALRFTAEEERLRREAGTGRDGDKGPAGWPEGAAPRREAGRQGSARLHTRRL